MWIWKSEEAFVFSVHWLFFGRTGRKVVVLASDGWLVGWWAGRTAKGDSIFETCRLPLSLVMDLFSPSCTQHPHVLTPLHILLQKIKALWRFGFWFPWGDRARGRVVGGGYVQSEQARESGLMMMIHPMPWLLLKVIQLWLYCTILDIPNNGLGSGG